MPPPTDQDIIALAENALPRLPNTFELGLVLGGTVSAGAYTAGVLDFLVQALDCWTAARDSADPAQRALAPKHKVALRAVTGTSGGGVNAAILARALAYEIPPVTPATSSAASTGNPFYDTWINNIRDANSVGLAALLDTSDLTTEVGSLLNGSPLDAAARFAAHFGESFPLSDPRGPKRRSWVGRQASTPDDTWDPLHVILTLTNLHGVPYLTDLGNGASQAFVNHADHARFALCYPGVTWAKPRPDEWALGFGFMPSTRIADWDMFSLFARATAAFPVGLPARALTRPLSDYRWRVAVVPQDNAPAKIRPLRPDWTQLVEDPATPETAECTVLCVDGGATDNEPIELARTTLSGVLGRNPRDPVTAWRAVLLVDPFAGRAPLGPSGTVPLVSLLGDLATALLQQTRYDSSDLMLAANPDVYSRFMITAKRAHSQTGEILVGDDALASAGLGAFLGFASQAFMRHDYLLGRRNCQDYLRAELVLAENAEVFASMWDGVDKSPYVQVSDGQRFLPLIPLIGEAAVPEASRGANPWPRGALNPTQWGGPIGARFARIAQIEGEGGPLTSLAGWLAGRLGQGAIADYAVKQIRNALATAKDPLI